MSESDVAPATDAAANADSSATPPAGEFAVAESLGLPQCTDAEATIRESSEQAEDLPPADDQAALREALAALRADHTTLQEQRQSLYDRYLRLAADFDNYRKRNERDWQEHRKRATAEVLRAVLVTVDNLDRALQTPPADAPGLRAGVELIRAQLLTALQGFGIAMIEARGQPFDPAQHEAVLLVDAEGVAGQHVVDVVQSGYTLHGEVLRPARVTVSR